MAIRATCDGCFMEYKVPNGRAGKAFKCKECGGVVRVPRPGQQSSAPSPALAPKAAPPRQRNKPSSAKPSSKRKKKKSSTASGGSGMMIGIVVAALAVIGIVGFLMMPKGDNEVVDANNSDAPAEGATVPSGNSATASTLSADEEAIIADLRELMLKLGKAKTPLEERMAAMEQFAADRNFTKDQILAIVSREQQARNAANHVDSNWQPLQMSPTSVPAWPSQAAVSVPLEYSAADISTPVLDTPFVLMSNIVSGGTQRHVFDLATSQEIGSWKNSLASHRNEQVSPDGQLVCIQEGYTAPISLHVVEARTGKTVQTISSPDLLKVIHLAFIGPKQLMVITPPTTERTTDKKRRWILFDATNGQELSRFERELDSDSSQRMAISPDGRYFVTGGRGKSIEVFRIADGKPMCALDLSADWLESGQFHSVAVSPNGNSIAVLLQRPLLGLRLLIIDAANGEIAHKVDLYGALTSLGAPLEMQSNDPLVWFPDGRNVLIGKLVAVDILTGRRVWQAQGTQVGNQTARIPCSNGLLYQVNEDKTTKLVTLPIDFPRMASTQSAWPADAALRPGMTVGLSVDLSAGGLDEVEDVVRTGLNSKLERLGFEVADTADRTLTIAMQEGAVSFSWLRGEEVLWESVATADTAMVPQLGHLKSQTPERALDMEGVVKVQTYPVPYFISGDQQWTLPMINQIDHKG